MRNAIPRVRNGPPADPNALRRERPSDQADWLHLPAAGRQGEPPPWPLGRGTKAELALWADLWAMPQAVAWEHYAITVADYVRARLVLDRAGVRAADRTLVKQYGDSLGLSHLALKANRWIIDEEAPVDTRSTRTQATSATRAKLRALEGGAA